MSGPRQPQSIGAVVGGGAVAGVIAGAVMLLAGMGLAAGMGAGATLPVRGIAAALSGVMALVGGLGTLIEGWLVQLAVSAVLGLIYTAIGWNLRKYRWVLIWGILYAIAAWAVFITWLLPAGDPTLSAYAGMMGASWFWLYIVFGVVLSISQPLRRGLGGAKLPQTEAHPWPLPKAS
ncbi:MAG: hypothetical protein ACRD1A_00030 [Terriglobales bacterium]